MLHSVIAHVSLAAVLVHLHWGGCAFHLPACERAEAAAHCAAGHHHAADDHPESPAEPPPHDDCHESHASAVMSQAAHAPMQDAVGAFLLPMVAAAADQVAVPGGLTAAIGRPAETCPLPLRAAARSQALLN